MISARYQVPADLLYDKLYEIGGGKLGRAGNVQKTPLRIRMKKHFHQEFLLQFQSSQLQCPPVECFEGGTAFHDGSHCVGRYVLGAG